ncbi:hypothetical protein Anas_10264 [Armadillidium nasatum]|uniref:Uncharacterized protein n=1 Tax=Armadillidium nasatum TaxID=96803 RepID=A0A5N5SMF8_9CRUS|nr:hypothetical protein Anas_10264 [Armadillidium nasatum]
MFFPCVVAAAAAATRSPAWFLSGAYHPPQPGRSGESFKHIPGGSETNGEISGEALTVALDVVQAWAVLLTLGFTLIIFFFLAFCVCSKKDDGYDEFEVTQGITTVKICHDGGENGVSYIPRIAGSGTESMKATDETSEASSRYTLKRELPAIPTSAATGPEGKEKSERPVSQHSSDLYASVNDSAQGSSSFKLIGGVQVLPAGAIAPGGRAAVVKECVSSPEDQIDGEFTQKKEKIPDDKVCPPYAQIKKGHPYAQDSKIGVTSVTSPHSSSIVTSCHSIVPPHTIPVSSITSPQYRSPTSPHTTEEPTPIPAAMAISGRTPANEEMPYMTPPVIQPTREQTQQHFSGDSQDSRGYTSISVREPLAALKARQGEGAIAALGRNAAGKGPVQTQGSEGEGYYMTVSDDSADEMYACIYEGGSRGTGSETYAQIEPRTTPTTQAPPSVLSASSVTPSSPTGLSSSRTPQDPSPPAPPSVDSLRHVLHSRQASASSSASTGMGSPVAEKRGTRSPLPPLPQGDTILYSPPEPPILSNQPAPKSPPKSISHIMDKPTPRSLEEMYAKVLKKPHGHSRGSSSGAVEGSGDPSSGSISARRGSAEIGGAGMWATTTSSKAAQDMSHSMVEGSRTHDISTSVNRAKSCEVSASWGVVAGLISDDSRNMKSHYTDGRNYETIPSHLYSGSDPGYETVKNGDPPYASVDPSENYPGYETVRGSDVDSEPGYETLKQKEVAEPGYETLSEVASKKSLTSEAGYESVTTTDYEPGYETVSSKKSDPGYESVLEKDKVEYDPGYEVLSHPTFNRTTSETDPNYEQLKFSSRPSSQEVEIGYEVVKKEATVEGNYELVSDYDTQMEPSVKSDKAEVSDLPSPSVPLYASVKKKESPKKETKDFPDLEKEKINENFNILNIEIPSENVSKEESPNDEVDFTSKAVEEEEEKIENEQVCDKVDIDLIDEETAKSDQFINEKYPVMDSPEEVELPPPGGEDNHRVSPPVSPEEYETQDVDAISPASKPDEIIEKETMPTVSLTFTEASPPLGSPETGSTKSSSSGDKSPTDSSPKTEQFEEQVNSFPAEKIESSPVNNKDEPLVDVIVPSAPPPQFSNNESAPPPQFSNNESDPPPQFSNNESAPPPQFSNNESAPPPQFSNNETEPLKEMSSFINSVEDALPPPPLPVLDDDIATASPPPPPPPIPDEVCGLQPDLPPPPVDKEPSEEQIINGMSPTSAEENLDSENFPVCGTSTLIEDLPPPLSSEAVEPEVNVISRNGLNGSMTVTVNPMADMDDTVGPTLISIAPITVLPTTESSVEQTVTSSVAPAPPLVPGGDSGESQSSGSTANGSGSVESIVTVDPKRGSDPSTIVPTQIPPQDSSPPAAPTTSSVIISPLQHSSSTSSSDSKHSDPNEGITPV